MLVLSSLSLLQSGTPRSAPPKSSQGDSEGQPYDPNWPIFLEVNLLSTTVWQEPAFITCSSSECFLNPYIDPGITQMERTWHPTKINEDHSHPKNTNNGQ